MNNINAFLAGFAAGADLDSYDEADEQWAGYSRQFSDKTRARIEAGTDHPGGPCEAGEVMGRAYRELHPDSAA